MFLQNFCTNSVPSRVWPMRGEKSCLLKKYRKNKLFKSHEIKMGSVYLIHLPSFHMNDSWCTLFQIVSNAVTYSGVIFLYSWYKSLAFQLLPSKQQIPFWYVSPTFHNHLSRWISLRNMLCVCLWALIILKLYLNIWCHLKLWQYSLLAMFNQIVMFSKNTSVFLVMARCC